LPAKPPLLSPRLHYAAKLRFRLSGNSAAGAYQAMQPAAATAFHPAATDSAR